MKVDAQKTNPSFFFFPQTFLGTTLASWIRYEIAGSCPSMQILLKLEDNVNILPISVVLGYS